MIILNSERSLKTCMNLWKLNGNFMHRFEEKNKRRFVALSERKNFSKNIVCWGCRLSKFSFTYLLLAIFFRLNIKIMCWYHLFFFRKRYCKNIKISAALRMSHCLNICRLISKAIAIQWILKQIVKTKIYFC